MLDLRLEYQYMKEDIDRAFQKCLDHQHWIMGPEVGELERKIAACLGSAHAIGCSSGTDALVLALRALAIQSRGREYWDRDDLVITTSFTFTATGDAILRAGATPLFVDIDEETYNLDPRQIQEAMDTLPQAKQVIGIIPVHLFGQACEMGGIMAIAEKHGLFIVEDVAQAFGGLWQGRKLGSLAAAGCFSFFPSKNLGGFGDGGMVVTGDAETAGLIRMLIKHGGQDKYDVEHVGYNSRLDTLQAAIILAKMNYIDELNEKRIAIAGAYNKGILDTHGLVKPRSRGPAPGDGSHVYHQYTLRARNRRRDEFRELLDRAGVASAVYYPVPLHRMKVFGGGNSLPAGPLSIAEDACDSVFSLPIEPLQSDKTTESVIAKVNDIATKLAAN